MLTHPKAWRRVSHFALVAVLAAVAVAARNAAGQGAASITGVVTDGAGAPIAAAAITATNTETGGARSSFTDSRGVFHVLMLSAGSYQVRAVKPGFRSEVRDSIAIAAGEQMTVDFVLGIGEMKQRITVKAVGPMVADEASQTFGLVGRREAEALPLNGRSYDELLTLTPGVVNFTSEKTGGVGVSNSAVANMFAAAGRRPQENLFLLNGVEYTGAAEINLQPGGTSGELLGVDAIREFNALTGDYGAQYGKRPGAQVLIVTRGGSNSIHGSLYEFARNSAFDARNFFDHGPIPQFQRNQYGAALGGPLQRNRTFIFGNYEGFRQKLGLSDVTLVPDQNARLGFLPGPGGAPVRIGIGAGVAPLLSLWPVQNGPELGNGIAEAFSHPVQAIHEHFGTARLDRNLSSRDSMSGVYTVDDSNDVTPTANPLSIDSESLREQVLSVDETHVFSPALLNVARFGYSRAAYFYTGNVATSVPGFIAGDPVGAIVIGGSATPNSPSQITLAGSNVGSHLFATRNLFTTEDSLAAVKGINQLTAGVWFQRIQANDELALGQYGQANFASLSDFLRGTVGTFSAVLSPTPLGWRSLEGAWFAEDAIRIKRGLNATLGFRDEFTDGWNEGYGRASNYVFATDGVMETQPRIARSTFVANRARLLPEPRLGVAWAPFRQRRTVIRAGFGIYADLLDDLSYRLDQNAPFNTTVTLANAPVATLHFVPGEALPSSGLISPGGVQPNLQTPMVASYSFQIDQAFGRDSLLRVAYVGSHAYHELVSIDANEPEPLVCEVPSCVSGTLFIAPGTPRPNPSLANSWGWFSEGNSTYNAFQTEIWRRWRGRFGFHASYTWSKSLDDGDTLNGSAAANAPTTVMDTFNPRLDWGPSTFNAASVAAIDGSYSLPSFGRDAGRRWERALLDGWTLDGVATIASGFPFTPQLGFNPSNNGDTRNPDRPSWNPSFSGPVIVARPDEYFNPAAFLIPATGTFGNVGRDALIGPGLAQADVCLMKSTRLTDRLKLQFRAEFFNLLNSANFNTPSLIVFTQGEQTPSRAAGTITSTSATSRQIQFGLKLAW